MIISMRIDRLLCELNIGTRSQVKELLKKGQVTVNDIVINKPDTKVNEQTDIIVCNGKRYCYKPFVYYMLNKPAGVITATSDTQERTVLDLFKEQYQRMNQGELSGIPMKDIFPVGRLDKDTVGLLVLTNDGEMAHRLLSPANHVPKKYYVETNQPLTEQGRTSLEEGVAIGKNEMTKPALVEVLEDKKYYITITEGKFHQIKRMFEAVGLYVTYLKRVSMGKLQLDETLSEGQIRELRVEEVVDLCSRI